PPRPYSHRSHSMFPTVASRTATDSHPRTGRIRRPSPHACKVPALPRAAAPLLPRIPTHLHSQTDIPTLDQMILQTRSLLLTFRAQPASASTHTVCTCRGSRANETNRRSSDVIPAEGL